MKYIQQATLSLVLIFYFFPSVAQPFRVQIAAYIEKVPFSYFSEAGVFGVYMLTDQNKIYRYYIGEFEKKEDATMVMNEVFKKGFKYVQIIDIEEQRRLCGTPCPYISKGNTYSDESTDFLQLQNIFFGFNRSTLSSDAKKELDKLYHILKENPQLKVLISGHTDSKGSAKYNVALSKRRARNARSYLINKGIKPKRIKAKVFGESDPVVSNKDATGKDSPDGRKFNRRAVLAIYDPTNGQIVHQRD